MGHSQSQVPIGRVVDSVGRGQVSVRVSKCTASWRPPPVIQVRRQHLELEIQQSLDQAGFDQSAQARRATSNQTGEDPLTQIVSGEHVGDCQGHRRGRIALVSTQPHNARPRLRQQILTRPIAPRFSIAVPRYDSVYQATIDLRHALIPKS